MRQDIARKSSVNSRTIDVTKRDNAYYKDRLQKEHPSLFAEVLAGRISLSDALKTSGLKKQRTRLHELKNAWDKASAVEQTEFIRYLKLSVKTAAPALPVVKDRRLLAWAKKRIEDIRSARSMTRSDVMDELGLSRSNTSLWMAIRRNTKLDPGMIAAIKKWLDANKKT